MREKYNRREFMKQSSAIGAGLALSQFGQANFCPDWEKLTSCSNVLPQSRQRYSYKGIASIPVCLYTPPQYIIFLANAQNS